MHTVIPQALYQTGGNIGLYACCRQFPSFPYLWLNSLGTGGSSWVFAPAWHRLTQVLNRHRFHFTMSKQFQIRGRNLIVRGKALRRVWNGKADGLVRRKGSHQTIETQEAACFLSFFFSSFFRFGARSSPVCDQYELQLNMTVIRGLHHHSSLWKASVIGNNFSRFFFLRKDFFGHLLAFSQGGDQTKR